MVVILCERVYNNGEEFSAEVTDMERNYKIIDAHTHIFPDKIADKAVASIGKFYDLPMQGGTGRPHHLDEQGEKYGIEHFLVFSAPTTPAQVHSINDFIHAKCQKYSRFIGLGSLHPEMENPLKELDRVVELGLRGLKFHPDFQQFAIDDEHMLPVYRRTAEYKLPILFHMGDKRYDFSRPRRLYNLLQKVPDLTVIAAHFGGYDQWEEAARYLQGGKNIWFDTSSTLPMISKDYARSLVAHFGADRLLFGTDYPMWDIGEELERFFSLDLTGQENEQILSGNFERLFQLVP